MSRFDDLAGSPIADPKVAEGLLKRAVRRAERLAERGALPTGGIYGDIAAVRDTADERAELAQRISEALQAGDRVRASRLIEIGRTTFGLATMAAAVEAQAREMELTVLRAAQDAVQLREPDQWPCDPDVYELDEEWLDDEPR
jgi:hypothetical protein